MTDIGIRNLRIDGEVGIVVPMNQSITAPLTSDALSFNAEFFDVRVVGNIQMLPIGKIVQVTQESPAVLIEKTEDDKLRGTVLPTVEITAETPQTVRFRVEDERRYEAVTQVDAGTTVFTGKDLYDLFKAQNPEIESPADLIGLEFSFEISAHEDCTARIVEIHEDGTTDEISWPVYAGEPHVEITELTAEGEGTMTIYAGSQTVTVSTGEGPVPDPYLNVEPSEFNIPKEGSQETVQIESNVGWEIISSQPWCRVNPTQGSANLFVDVEIQENLTSAQRVARLSVVAGDLIRFVDITQEGQETDPRVHIDELSSGGEGTMTVEAGSTDVQVTTEAPEPYLNIDQDEIDVDSQSQEVSFIVTSNISWEVMTGSTWCRPLTESGRGDALVRIQVDENDSSEQREDVITVSRQGLSRLVTIIQSGNE